MSLRNIHKKARASVHILKNEGVLSFGIKSLQHIQKKTNKTVASKTPISVRVKYKDVISIDMQKKIAAWKGTNRQRLRFNWIMPPPGKGSGGHLNIFRFIKYLEDAGHENRIYLYADGGGGPVSHIYEAMGDSYPTLATRMEWLHNKEMKEADGVFATSWETAYASFNSNLKAKRFYFVQDFEPYFYPVGSFYALTENTYTFGFHGITAGGWLAEKLHKDYGMQTDYFNFGSDKSMYFMTNHAPRKEVFFYARPYTERRGFEIGIIALDLFHRKHPDYIVNLAGWDVSGYQLPFPYVNLKTLELHELNEIYNKCALGLVMSFTNMSLLPLELMGSGTIPVVNDGPNNRLVSDNPYIAYSPNDPVSLARTMSGVVSRKDLPEYAAAASVSAHTQTWEESGKKFVGAIEKETRRHG